MKFMEKIKGIKFEWKIGLDTVLLLFCTLLGFAVGVGTIRQKLNTIDAEQEKLKVRMEASDEKNNFAHQRIYELQANTSAKIDAHIRALP